MWQNTLLLDIFFILLNLEFSLGNSTIGCIEQPSCLLCKSARCVKCTSLIIYPTRECVSDCPHGYKVRWSTYIDYMGRMCVHSGFLGGLSAESAAIFVGICSGAIICIAVITIGIFYIRYRRNKQSSSSSETPSDTEDSPERKDFLKQLETLRPYANTLLNMLNDTRRQIRQLHGTGDNAAITAYKPVVRDLAKILLLLNRPVEKLSVIPEDWDHLFIWTEKTLKRYKRMSEVSQPQVAQLVSFLQTPVHSSSPTFSQTLSTFKPEQHFSSGSALSLQDIAVQNFNCNYDNNFISVLNPQWNFNYSLVTPTPVTTNCNRDYLNSSYLLEDDFFQFGLRPQDEITTEL